MLEAFTFPTGAASVIQPVEFRDPVELAVDSAD